MNTARVEMGVRGRVWSTRSLRIMHDLIHTNQSYSVIAEKYGVTKSYIGKLRANLDASGVWKIPHRSKS